MTSLRTTRLIVAALCTLTPPAIAAEAFPNDAEIARALREQGAPPAPLFRPESRHAETFDRLIERAQGAQRGEGTPPARKTADVLIFVSLAMPRASLERLARDASRIGAVLLLRGLQNESLATTRAALAPIIAAVQPAPTFQIHPGAFATYAVTSVPTIVVTGPATEGPPRFAGVAGDVSLGYALEHLARSGSDFALIAGQRAAALRERASVSKKAP